MSKNYRRGGRNFSRGPPKEATTSEKTKQVEQLTETDVGITEYVSSLPGFSGVVKARYSDFQVNEINLAGDIAVLTNTKIPPEFNNAQNKGGGDEKPPEKSPLEIIPQGIWDKILEMMGESPENKNKIVEFEVSSLSKEQRSDIHMTIKGIFKQKIVASTITKEDNNSTKYMEFKKYNKDEKLDRSNQFQWPKDLGQYVHFLVYKENIDTLDATLQLSSCLKMKPSALNYAGVKDRRGKTTQWFSVKKVEPWKLLKRTRPLKMIRLGNFTFKNEPLKLGQLKGNQFRIALRNVIADEKLINEALEGLRDNGFINYYGLQRFGNDKEVPTYEIGLQLLLGNFKEACNLILKCKSGDKADLDTTKAKKLYRDTGDAKAASECFKENTNKCLESKLLIGLAKSSKNEYVNALENIPRNMRLMYIHAFQALIWNKAVSKRLKEFGLKPIVGDMVFVGKDEGEEMEVEEDKSDAEETDESGGSNNAEEVDNRRKKQEVKHLAAEDLDNYSLYDVVLPLPGYDIDYPDNIVKDWYKEMLEEVGLSLEMPKQSVKTYTLSGTYRNIMQKVTNLSWKIMHYNDPNDNLIMSDFDRILKREEPQDCPGGKYKALLMEFCLKPSSYATMVLREILKADTSRSAQEKLNNYGKKETSSPPLNCAQPKSLLSDPEKFAEFKKSIFGEVSSAPKRKLEEGEEAAKDSPVKKSKANDGDAEAGETAEEVKLTLKPDIV